MTKKLEFQKIKQCEKCKSKMIRSYVRLNIKGKRLWYPIGYFCMNCKQTFKRTFK